jgi:ankyrin repeat protein
MLKKDYSFSYNNNSGSSSNTANSSSIINTLQTCNITDEFYKACVCGDFESAMAFIKMGVNLNVRFQNGQNLLHIACAKNFYGLAQLLIKFGCNEFLKDNDGRTSLHYAVISNSTSIVRYLIEKNIFTRSNSSTSDLLTKEFLNVQDNEGKTALHLACQYGYLEIARLILNTQMADVNLRDLKKKTPLMIANETNSIDICELLIKSGSIIDTTVLANVCSKGNLTELKIILKYDYAKRVSDHLKYKLTSKSSNSYLYLAIKYSFNLKFINEMLELGARPILNDMYDLLDDAKTQINQSNSSTLYYLECMILLLKYNCFNRLRCKTNSDYLSLAKYIKCLKLNENFIIEYDSTNASKLIIMILFQVISDLYDLNDSSIRKRFVYTFALAIYSSQLNFRKVYFKQWLKQLTTLKHSTNNNQSNSSNCLNELNNLLKDSISNPWSLQMLCRNVIRKNLDNVNDLLNDDRLVKKMNLSETCVRYLKFEFI